MPHGSGLSMWLIAALVIVVWPVAFIALWSGIVWLMAAVGGWRRLATRYRATERPTGGRTLTAVSGMVGVARYRGLLTITTNEHGMFLEIRWIFRLAHPTLFIPWSAVRNVRKVSQFYRKGIAFDVGNPRLAGMRLPTDVFTGTPVLID